MARPCKHGLHWTNIPEEYGGGGAGMVELTIVCEETAARGCPLLLLLVSSAISAELLTRYAAPNSVQSSCRAWHPGRPRFFAITEPDAGSNSRQISTTAVRDGADYVINGTKYYISGVDEAEALIVVTRTAPEKLSLFLVPTDSPGLVKHRLPVGISVPEKQFTLHFDNVRVPAANLVGTERRLPPGLRRAQPGALHRSGRLRGHRTARHRTGWDYARTRAVWGPRSAPHQAIAHPLAQAKINVDLAAMMTTKAAWLFDQGLPAGEASNMAKFAAAEAAVAGGPCHPAARRQRPVSGVRSAAAVGLARLLRIAPVSREMILNYVAQHSLALPRSY